MVQLSTLLAAALSYSSFLSVSASPVAAVEGVVAFDDVAVPTFDWRGSLEDGKPEVTLTGTSFEDIEAQVKAINPAYTIFGESNETAEETGLQARKIERITCYLRSGWVAAERKRISDGIKYLNGIKGNCHAPAGPGGCARVSCSWKAAIFFCNDNRQQLWQPCKWIASTAQSIVEACTLNERVYGQAFIDRNWNVLVREAAC